MRGSMNEFEEISAKGTPETRLITAVLVRAIADAIDAIKSSHRGDLKDWEHVEWFMVDEWGGPGLSFRDCCEILNLDFEATQSRLLRKLYEEDKKIFLRYGRPYQNSTD